MANRERSLEECLSRLEDVVGALPRTYADRDRLYEDVGALLEECSTMVPQSCTLVRGGRQITLFFLAGVLPISYKGVAYNIPVTVYLDPTYPDTAPRCFVTPTAEMSLRPGHANVDKGGMIRVQYLQQWSGDNSSLVDLVPILADVFSSKPPVFAKPKDNQKGRKTQRSPTSIRGCGEGTRLEAVLSRIGLAVSGLLSTRNAARARSWPFGEVPPSQQEDTPLLDGGAGPPRPRARAAPSAATAEAPTAVEHHASTGSTSLPSRPRRSASRSAPLSSMSMESSQATPRGGRPTSPLPVDLAEEYTSEKYTSEGNGSNASGGLESTSAKRFARRHSEVWVSMKETMLRKVEKRARDRWDELLDPMLEAKKEHIAKRGDLLQARAAAERELRELQDMNAHAKRTLQQMCTTQRQLESFLQASAGGEVNTTDLKGSGTHEAVLNSVARLAALDDYLQALEDLLSKRKISIDDYMHQVRDVSREQYLLQKEQQRVRTSISQVL